MPAVVLIGAQWGDEGKGKATDLLGGRVPYVVRYQGGNNAGAHGDHAGRREYALHLIPSGILTPGCTPVIGNGVVIDPEVLIGELAGLEERGVDTSRLVISSDAHLIMPHHRALDKVTERFLGKRQIGTTGRGIGPPTATRSPASASACRTCSTCRSSGRSSRAPCRRRTRSWSRSTTARRSTSTRSSRSTRRTPRRSSTASSTPGSAGQGPRRRRVGPARGVAGHAARRRPRHLSVRHVVQPDGRRRGGRLRHRAHPHRAGGRHPEGVHDPRRLRARSPTELFDANGEYLRKQGGEVGVTTGRDRRCGWFDAVVARYASRVNGITDYFLTKLDVLSGLETVPICVAYDVDGVRHDEMPMTQTDFHHAEADLRGDAGLVRGHPDLPEVRRAARRTPRPTCGGSRTLRRPGQRHRRRPRPRRERGHQRFDWLILRISTAARSRPGCVS